MKNENGSDANSRQENEIVAEAIQDPRCRNEWFDATTMRSYLDEYADRVRVAIRSVDAVALDRAREMLEEVAASGKQILAIGNGGSAAIAEHLCCDLTKGTHHASHPTLDTRSLTSNVALYSAIANDFGFETVFSRQLRFFGRPGDVLLAISSSGNSPNVISAVDAAKGLDMRVIGLSGFGGGQLGTVADVPLVVDSWNYGVIEDAHQAIMHIIAQYIACQRDGWVE